MSPPNSAKRAEEITRDERPTVSYIECRRCHDELLSAFAKVAANQERAATRAVSIDAGQARLTRYLEMLLDERRSMIIEIKGLRSEVRVLRKAVLELRRWHTDDLRRGRS